MSDLYLSGERYLAALVRIRGLIAAGAPLEAIDDETPGAKSTECSWGLCSREPEAWPDAEDHIWPEQFRASGRVAPKYRAGDQPCPMSGDRVTMGCFYSCRIFKATRKRPAPSRDEALRLYDETIEVATRRFGRGAEPALEATAGEGEV